MATITVTKGYNHPTGFTSGQTVTPAILNSAQTPSVTIADIATADISNSAITTAKIADANVTTAKIADANVTTAKIADANVTTAKIADANVTLAKLATAVQQALLPAGAVQAFAMNSAPPGWLAANGAAVSRTTYAELFSAIGTTYGAGNGSTTFELPDLRGIFVRGSGSQTISGRTFTGTFATTQRDIIGAHYHQPVAGTGYGYGYFSSGTITSDAGRSGFSDFLEPSPTTGRPETRPANIALLYCIKF